MALATYIAAEVAIVDIARYVKFVCVWQQRQVLAGSQSGHARETEALSVSWRAEGKDRKRAGKGSIECIRRATARERERQGRGERR